MMRLSRTELDNLIKEEINEIFGFGKKESAKTYPADEIVAIMRAVEEASRLAGAQLTPDQREAIVDEFMGALKSRGFVVNEQERLEIGEKDILITHQNAPKLKVFLDTVVQKNPKVFKQLLGVFNRGAFDISPLVKTLARPVNRVTTVNQNNLATRDADNYGDDNKLNDKGLKLAIAQAAFLKKNGKEIPALLATAIKDASGGDEDQTATIKTAPVRAAAGGDEDQTATIKTAPVRAPAAKEEPPLDLDSSDPATPPEGVPPVSGPDPEKEEEESDWDPTLDKVQAALDIAGLAGLTVAGEVVGTPATVASLALNTARGKYPMALLDIIALVPVVGKMAKAGKLGKAAMAGATAAKWKTGRALIGTLGSARAARGVTTGASSAAKGAVAASQLKQGAAGIVEMLPDALLKQVVLAKTDEGEPWVDHAIDTVGELPIPGLGLEEKAAKLRELWADVKEDYWDNAPLELDMSDIDDDDEVVVRKPRRGPDQIGPLKEQKELDRMKVLAGIK